MSCKCNENKESANKLYSCNCPVKDLSTDCILYTGDNLSCSNIEGHIILTDLISQLDKSICEILSGDVTTLSRSNNPLSNNNNFTLNLGGTGNDSVTLVEPTGLEKLGLGWRLIGRNSVNYSILGFNAIDFSESTQSTGLNGATGRGSFSTGLNSRATGDYSFTANSTNRATGFGASAFGLNNEGSGFFSFVTGNNNVASGERSFSTGGSNISSGIFSATFGRFNTASDDDGFAVNFANQVTGQWAFGSGNNNIASGQSSSVFGASSESSGWHSTSFGETNLSSGDNSMTLGQGVFARSGGEISIGVFGTDYVALQSDRLQNLNPLDRVFNIGNGTSTNNRSDAFTILKNGEITAPSLTTTLIDNEPTGRVLITKEWFNANNSSGGGTLTRTGSNTSPNNTFDISNGTDNITVTETTGLEKFGSGWKFIGNTNTTLGSNVIAFSSNGGGDITGAGSILFIGDNNEITSTNSLISGQTNTVLQGGNNTVVGNNNTLNLGTDNYIFGLSNTLDNNSSIIQQNSILGNGNTSSASNAIILGYGNEASEPIGRRYMLGSGLISKSIDTLVVGLANEDYTPLPNTSSTGNPFERLFVVGNGTANGGTAVGSPSIVTRSDAFKILKNGEITAPSLTTTLIDNEPTGRVLITKEWFNANNSSELEQVGSGGYRYRNIDDTRRVGLGFNALDLTVPLATTSNLHGASGSGAIAIGNNARAEGDFSIAMGVLAIAVGDQSVALSSGRAEGNFSFAVNTSNAYSFGEASVGCYGTEYVPSDLTSPAPTDRVLNVGNGTSSLSSDRSDAFTVYKNGAVQLHPVSLSSITNAQTGMLVVDSSDSNKLKFYNGNNWIEL